MKSGKALQEQVWYQDERLRSVVMREDASWRKMFPVQPPAPISMVLRGGGCTDDGMGTIQHGHITPAFAHLHTPGARMGLIYDILIDEIEGTPNALFL